MIAAPLPGDEPRRLSALQNSGLLDSPPDPFLDTLMELVARRLAVQTCLVSLIDRDRQWFKARSGLDSSETPRDCSFCAHMLWWTAPLVVPDSHLDERFVDNPLVVGGPEIRFYAGVPLQLHGMWIGALCVIDPVPRHGFERGGLPFLTAMAALVEDRLAALGDGPHG